LTLQRSQRLSEKSFRLPQLQLYRTDKAKLVICD
jgi:hypothetical protein